MVSAHLNQFPDLTVNLDEELSRYKKLAEEFRPCVTDTIFFMNQAVRQNKNILVEGANATMLDIDFGNIDPMWQ